MEKRIKIDNQTYQLTSDDDYLSAMGEEFEPPMVQLFKAFVRPDDIVIDIGGNIGLTSILFSALATQVYTFEPSPTTFKILKENLFRAGVNNVEAINLGLGKQQEKMTITFATNNRSGGFISDKIKPGKGHITEEIKIETLDNFFFGKIDRLDFIKIDVEGFESSVIKGGANLIEKYKPIVILELNHFCLNVFRRISVPDFFDFLRSVFPYLYAVDNDNIHIMDLHNPDQAYHVMHEHVVRFRFPNLVAGFNPVLIATIKDLENSARIANEKPEFSQLTTPEVMNPAGFLQVLAVPTAVKCNEHFSLKVDVSNQSDCPWLGYGNRPVFLSYHWLDEDGNCIIFDGIRSQLSKDKCEVLPGQILHSAISIVAPPTSGSYKLIVTLVQENICWFEQRGFKPAEINVSVL